MTRRTTHSLAPRPSPLSPGGFTFIEVLFAVIILGIGSIMIAGMLPVAIKQSSDTRNAITGKAACEAGYAYIQAIANAQSSSSSALPVTTAQTPVTVAAPGNLNDSPGRILPLSKAVLTANPTSLLALQTLTGSRVVSSDPRTQWLAFYGRSTGSTAKLVVLALHLNNVEGQLTGVGTIDKYAGLTSSGNAFNTLTNDDNGPFLLQAAIVDGGALDADRITLTNSYASNGLLAAETNAFVIVANAPAPGGNVDNDRPYRNNGRVFRLGKYVSGSATSGPLVYELQPGYDLPAASLGPDNLPNTPDDVADTSMDASTQTQVWIVGKGLLNPASPYDATTNPFAGLVQDVGVLTTQIQLPN